jgi:hypothetical protein
MAGTANCRSENMNEFFAVPAAPLQGGFALFAVASDF